MVQGMNKKHKHLGNKTFWNKIMFKYKLSVLNEKTLEEIFHLRLSLFSGILFSAMLFVLVVLVVSTLIVKTPLKNFLPGYLDINMRQDIVENALKLDSLETALKKHTLYLSGIKEIINGTIQPDSIMNSDSLAVAVDAKALEKSAEEKEFVKKHEEEEKYNLSFVVKDGVDQIPYFYKPCKGKVISGYNLNDYKYDITLSPALSAPISSISEGVVVYTGNALDRRYIVQVQHANNMLSIYRGLGTIATKIGKRVKSGEVLGFSDAKNPDSYIYLEIWKEGRAIDPQLYIRFEQ